MEAHSLMKLPPEERGQRRAWGYLLAGGIAAAVAVVVFLLLRS